MSVFALKFLTSYLLMPLLAILFCFIAVFLAKKNKLLKNKKLTFYILLTSVLLSLPALFGFINYWFMPSVYILLSVFYLVLGWYNAKWLGYFFPDMKKNKSYLMEFFICFLMMFIGSAFFSLIFNLCNELQYGLWACTCLSTFIFPSLYMQTYQKYMEIPLEIYKEWEFSSSEDLSSFEMMDYNNLLIMELELFKNANDTTPSKIKAKAPDNMPFGKWFQKCLADYNTKFPLTPIEVSNEHEIYKWIFYVKPSFFHPRKYIDYELSISENKIKEKHSIIAKRVQEQENNSPKNMDKEEIDIYTN